MTGSSEVMNEHSAIAFATATIDSNVTHVLSVVGHKCQVSGFAQFAGLGFECNCGHCPWVTTGTFFLRLRLRSRKSQQSISRCRTPCNSCRRYASAVLMPVS